MVHTKRCPAYGFHEAHIVVVVEGEIGSAIVRHPITETVDIAAELPELSFSPEEPFHQWKVGVDAAARLGYGPLGFVATHPSGSSHVSAELVLESDLPVADWKVGLIEIAKQLATAGFEAHNSAQEHYEQGGRWHGTLEVGGRRVEKTGLFVRDHSWGERVEAGFGGTFWTATALDSGNLFCNAIGFTQGESTVGVGIRVSPAGTDVTASVAGTLEPAAGIASYDRSAIRYGFDQPFEVEGRSALHLPLYLPYSGENRYDNNAISRATAGDLAGFAVMEWASVLLPEQSRQLDEASDHTRLPVRSV